MIKENAYFISRYKHNTNIYLGAGSSKKSEKAKEKQVTLKKLTKGMQVNEVRSKQVYIGGQAHWTITFMLNSYRLKKKKTPMSKNIGVFF